MPNLHATCPLVLHAQLPHPVSVNRSYRSTRGGRWFKTDAATVWQECALLQLRIAGFQCQPPGPYFIHVRLTLWTRRHDADSCIKLTLDTLARALAVDDKWVASVSAHKVPVRWRRDERIEVEAEVRPLTDQAEFEQLCVESVSTR